MDFPRNNILISNITILMRTKYFANRLADAITCTSMLKLKKKKPFTNLKKNMQGNDLKNRIM